MAAKIRAGCYLRISSDPRDKRAGITRQREDTAALCEVKGWTPVEVYTDNDRSASNGKDRPQWDRLLADIKAGRIDAIAAWDQDRGWRMMSELEQLRGFFTSLGRPVQFATTGQGDIDLYSPAGVLTAQIKTAVSEHEIAMMRVRQLRATRQRAESGRPKWRKAFGYLPYEGTAQEDTGMREPDPEVAPLVADAYRLILSGASLGSVCALFNNSGAVGLNGKPWTPSTVSLFLRAPRNAGLRSYQGQIIGPGTWPGLVDEQVWRSAQAVLDGPNRKKPGRKSVRRHLLTGVMACGREGCDGRLGGMWNMQLTGGRSGRPPNGATKEPHPGQVAHRITYACKTCRRCSIRAERVEPLLMKAVEGRLSRPDAVDLLKAEQSDLAEAEQLRTQRLTLLNRLDELTDGLADPEQPLDLRAYHQARDQIQAQLEILDSAEADQERLRVFDGIPLGTPEVAAAVAELVAMEPDRYRAILDLLVSVTVAPHGKRGNTFNPERVRIEWHR